MDIRNSLDGLRSLLGVNPAAHAAPQSKSSTSAAATGSAFDSDRATFSSAASEVSQAVSGEGVRTDKVAAVQSGAGCGNLRRAGGGGGLEAGGCHAVRRPVSLERRSLVMLSMKMRARNSGASKELVAEASCALARLDTARLEELALQL